MPRATPTGSVPSPSTVSGREPEKWVLLVSGSSARQAHRSELSPVDLCVIGIVDEVVAWRESGFP